MAHDPPNPYAPSEALANEAAADAKHGRRPSRAAAVITGFLSYPVAGLGFHLLGLRRRFAAWTAGGVLLLVLTIAGVWVPLPKIAAIAGAALWASWLISLVATGIAKPADVRIRGTLARAVGLVVAARAGFVAVGLGLVQMMSIPSGSMVPSLLVGDQVLIKKGHGGIRRGDVVVFDFPRELNASYLKRVVALEGETVEVRGGVVSINGVPVDQQPIDEPCSYRGDHARDFEAEAVPCTLVRETKAGRAYTIMRTADHAASDQPPIVVPPGHVFVLGDNRDNSHDSRHFGPVPLDTVKGTATVVLFSRAGGLSRIGRAIE